MNYNVAIIGATGMVGSKFLEILSEYKFPIKNLYLFASKKSAGKIIDFEGQKYTIIELKEENIIDKEIDFALFSAGGDISSKFCPIFSKNGALVIDNSSAFRMDSSVPLVVPEVNGSDILNHKGIIANPNCSTISAVVALKPLYDNFGIKRIIYSTYQAVSGAGVSGHNDLTDGISGNPPKKFPKPIFSNVIPHIDVFLENGYTKEEEKMINETKKILHDDSLKITATCVRVPVYNCHSESINVELSKQFSIDQVMDLYKNSNGVKLMDDTKNAIYPTPYDVDGSDLTFVGRIRKDTSNDNSLNLWIVGDNIRKGAASNAVQIALWCTENNVLNRL